MSKEKDVNEIFDSCDLLREQNSFVKLRQLVPLDKLCELLGLDRKEVLAYVDELKLPPSTILHKIEFGVKSFEKFKEKEQFRRPTTVEDAIQFSKDIDTMNQSYVRIPFTVIMHAWLLGRGIL